MEQLADIFLGRKAPFRGRIRRATPGDRPGTPPPGIKVSAKNGRCPYARRRACPLTFSITQGILWGFILHAVLHAVVGRARAMTGAAWGLAVVAVALLVIEHAN